MFATGRVSLDGSETSRLIHGRNKGIFGGVGSRRDVCCVHLEVMHYVAWYEVFLPFKFFESTYAALPQKSVGFPNIPADNFKYLHMVYGRSCSLDG